MNWRVIAPIAALGVAMGLASVFGLTRGIELWLWVGVWVVAAVAIARALTGRRFLHGLVAGGLAALAAPIVQAALLPTYRAHNPELAASLDQVPSDLDPRIFFLATAPIIAAVSGLVVGSLAWMAGRLIGRGAPAALATVFMAALAAPAGAQEPELVQPGVISLKDRNETFPAIDPVDGSLWFSVYEENFNAQTIMVARPAGQEWAPAEVATFSGTWGDRAPRFSPEGAHLYFSSNRPAPEYPEKDWNVWVIERAEDGSWREPALVGPPVSVPGASDYHVSVTTDGTIYVPSNRGGGRGDVYRVDTDGGIEPVAAINDSLSQPDLYVDPSGDWMIVVVSDHPAGLGGDDFFVSRFRDGVWSAPEHVAAPINSEEYEYGPTLSQDGRWLYFTSHRRGTADVYRVSLEALGLEP